MLDEIKGIGPKTKIELTKLNINNIEDLLMYYPYKYNYYKPVLISEIHENEEAIVNGIINSVPKVSFIKRNLNRMQFNLNTGNELIKVVIFNRSFLKAHLQLGKTISVIGKYSVKSNTFTASDIRLKPILSNEVEPVYKIGSKIKRTLFSNIIREALYKNIDITNYIPDNIMEKYKFINKNIAVKNIHVPTSTADLKHSKLVLIYEELFIFMLKINYLKLKNTELKDYDIKNIDNNDLQKFIKELPFDLTSDQKYGIDDIYNDFRSHKRMNRLLLGDVGTGKTIVAFAALYMNFLANYQGILMAPTEILAVQHYESAKKIFENTRLKIALLTSSTTKKDRKNIIKEFKENKINIIIGTHSVLNSEVSGYNIGLVITDEQHRFGVKQRQMLQQKGKDVDVLYMSATPIPRTLALTIYGDMDITEIKDKPFNNKLVKTRLIQEKNIKEVLTRIIEQIKLGYQVYIIVPAVEENEEMELENVNSIYNKLNNAFNSKIPMDIIHGKLKADQKDKVMNDFKENKTKILVSTTVIEVGIDVKNATTIVIFNAERFGLATLHQLRGRVGRSDLDSYCYLISDHDTERLKIMEKTNDGFEISEKDFELRGTGDLFGLKQSGEMDFKLANLKTDYKILLQCKKDSEEFLETNITNLELYPVQKSIINSIMFID